MLCHRHSNLAGLRPVPFQGPSPGFGVRLPSLRQHQRHVARADKNDKGKGKPDDKADPNKADFSAYWALQFRNLFSKRREYLEGASFKETGVKKLKEYEEKVDAEIAEQRQLAEKAREEFQGTMQQVNARDSAAAEEAFVAIDQKLQKSMNLSPEVKEAVASGAAGRVLTMEEVVVQDINSARGSLQSTRFKAFTLAILQFRELLKAVVMAPITVPLGLHSRWQALFASQRYENFLMAEGERVWYWRNRQENERWFWETMFFDRIVAPMAWTCCYMYIVPNNFLWGVMVPLTFIYWQTGALPALISLEGLLIAYLGFWQKSWPQVAGCLAAVMQWF